MKSLGSIRHHVPPDKVVKDGRHLYPQLRVQQTHRRHIACCVKTKCFPAFTSTKRRVPYRRSDCRVRGGTLKYSTNLSQGPACRCWNGPCSRPIARCAPPALRCWHLCPWTEALKVPWGQRLLCRHWCDHCCWTTRQPGKTFRHVCPRITPCCSDYMSKLQKRQHIAKTVARKWYVHSWWACRPVSATIPDWLPCMAKVPINILRVASGTFTFSKFDMKRKHAASPLRPLDVFLHFKLMSTRQACPHNYLNIPKRTNSFYCNHTDAPPGRIYFDWVIRVMCSVTLLKAAQHVSTTIY